MENTFQIQNIFNINTIQIKEDYKIQIYKFLEISQNEMFEI